MDYHYAVFKIKSSGWFGAIFSTLGLYELNFPCTTEQLAIEQLSLDRYPQAEPITGTVLISEELGRFFDGEKLSFSIPIDWSDYTVFQRQVLQYTAAIPHGRAVSYGDVALNIGNPKACRAVGQALHINRTPIVVPCHRVLAAGHKLGGFGGGLAHKRTLLELEGIVFRE